MIAYTVFENKETNNWVTFVHGAGGSSTIWYKQIKAFSKYYNVLLVDLRGHGSSNEIISETYTFKSISNDVLEVLIFLNIKKSHFVGISLGTIIIRHFAEMNTSMVQSMIMGGAILKMNFRSQILMLLGNSCKYFLPYMVLYKFFAYIIMPNANHKKSRLLFVNEAKKMQQKEFIKWFKLTSEINQLLRNFRQKELNIPTFYIMGSEDYMFLPTIKRVVENHIKFSKLIIVDKCGHIVNIEKAKTFNSEVLNYLQNLNP